MLITCFYSQTGQDIIENFKQFATKQAYKIVNNVKVLSPASKIEDSFLLLGCVCVCVWCFFFFNCWIFSFQHSASSHPFPFLDCQMREDFQVHFSHAQVRFWSQPKWDRDGQWGLMPHSQGPIPKLETPSRQMLSSTRNGRRKSEKYSTETLSGSGNISPHPRFHDASNNPGNIFEKSPAEHRTAEEGVQS